MVPFCPYGEEGTPYKKKITLFWNEEDFNDSENSGFLMLEDGDTPEFLVRNEGKVEKVSFKSDGTTSSNIAPDILHVIRETYKNYTYLF
jgi:putative selenate reductase